MGNVIVTEWRYTFTGATDAAMNGPAKTPGQRCVPPAIVTRALGITSANRSEGGPRRNEKPRRPKPDGV